MSKDVKRFSICATKGYEKEAAHLSEQPNRSLYIWKLIREDLMKESEDSQILDIVRQAMQNVTTSLPNVPQSTQKEVKSTNIALKKGAMSILGD